jgi:hypothetical protein
VYYLGELQVSKSFRAGMRTLIYASQAKNLKYKGRERRNSEETKPMEPYYKGTWTENEYIQNSDGVISRNLSTNVKTELKMTMIKQMGKFIWDVE